MFTYGGKQRSRTPSRLREPGFQGQSQDQPRCITFQLVAGDRFELPMIRPYERGLLTTLPALTFKRTNNRNTYTVVTPEIIF